MSATHVIFMLLLSATLSLVGSPVRAADLEPELGDVTTLGEPDDHWLLTLGFLGGGNIWDGDTGEMQGKVNLSDYTSAVTIDLDREMIYVPGSHYSRGTYGDRTDVVVFNDLKTLSPVGEVVVPSKLAAVFHRHVINPVGNRFLVLYNMTPAMSVSVVDVEERSFVGEISTAGCAFAYPLTNSRFMQLCGDGTIQIITLDNDGEERARVRSQQFFDPEIDPVFDFAVAKPDGWILVSFEGLVYEVTVTDDIDVSEPWSLLTEEDIAESWRVGGNEHIAFNAEHGVLFTLMHQGGPDTHEDEGTEVWAYDFGNRRRGYRLALDEPSSTIGVSNDSEPLLYITTGFPARILVHNAVTGRHIRTIEEAGLSASHVQVF